MSLPTPANSGEPLSPGQTNLPKSHLMRHAAAVIALGFILSVVAGYAVMQYWWRNPSAPGSSSAQASPTPTETRQWSTFDSAEELRQYWQEFANRRYAASLRTGIMENAMPVSFDKAAISQSGTSAPERVSQTNVRTAGVDEPDIVKADDGRLYISRWQNLFHILPLETRAIVESDVIIPGPSSPPVREKPQNKVLVMQAFPPEKFQQLAEITDTDQAKLLLHKNSQTLLLIKDQQVTAYSVSNPTAPAQTWQLDLADRYSLVAVRLVGDQLYLVSFRSRFSQPPVCPFQPVKLNGQLLPEVDCSQIYRPDSQAQIDGMYLIQKVSVRNGQMAEQVALPGSWTDDRSVYLIKDWLMLPYAMEIDYADMFIYAWQKSPLIPEPVKAKLRRLKQLDISRRAKQVELEEIMQQWKSSLDDDEQLRVESELENQTQQYVVEYLKQHGQTSLVLLSLSPLKVHTVGQVPGRLLNNFSIDYYQGYWRVATTLDRLSQESRSSAVYVLDQQLQLLSQVDNLGRGERIYSVRFLGDRAYVVTFRETDPFYIIDLSNPRAIRLTGELKIPGFSSYLHPVAKDLILGVGRADNRRVKVSLFDVSNSYQPREVAVYVLPEYASELLNNYRAFLQDSKHQVVFIPGSQHAYVVSYANQQLQLASAMKDLRPLRAVYMDDYLYVIGQDEIVVKDETNWQTVKRVELAQ